MPRGRDNMPWVGANEPEAPLQGSSAAAWPEGVLDSCPQRLRAGCGTIVKQCQVEGRRQLRNANRRHSLSLTVGNT